MNGLARKLLWSLLFGTIVLVGLALYADVHGLADSLGMFDWRFLPAVVALTFGSYLLRFPKWHVYLRCIDVRIPWTDSLIIFLSGMSLTVTPGKLGEVIKSVFLKEAHGVEIARSAPIVAAERLTDMLSVLGLAMFGAVYWGYGLTVMLAGGLLAFGFLAVISYRRLSLALIRLTGRLPLIRRLTPTLERAYESMAAMLRPVPLVATTSIGTLAWFGECVGFWLVVNALPGVRCDLGVATFVYALSTIAGAVTFLPGGLIATEITMVGLLQSVFAVVPSAGDATAATLIIRFATLWFAVVVGLAAVVLFRILRRRRAGRAAAAAAT